MVLYFYYWVLCCAVSTIELRWCCISTIVYYVVQLVLLSCDGAVFDGAVFLLLCFLFGLYTDLYGIYFCRAFTIMAFTLLLWM